MASCEKCWGDAYLRSRASGEAQSTEYYKLLEERKDHPCSPKESAGQFWDEENQCDRRFTAKKE